MRIAIGLMAGYTGAVLGVFLLFLLILEPMLEEKLKLPRIVFILLFASICLVAAFVRINIY